MLDAVIFDVDGTLVDTVVHEIVSWHETFARRRFDISRDAIRRQMGKGADHLLETLLPHESKRVHDELGELQGKIFRAQHRPDIRPFPHVASLFRRLRNQGCRVALGSSGDAGDIRHYLRLAGATDLVDVIVCMDDVKSSKPDPEIFEVALRRLGMPSRQRVLAVGDTIYDAQAAAAAGLRTIGVLGGAFSRETLLAAGCVAVYRDVTELFERFDASPLALQAATAVG